VPNEYLYYYYRNREAVRAILDSASTRGEYLAAQQNGLFRQLLAEPARAADLWRAAVAERDASYMAEARGHAAGAPDAGAAEAPAAHAPLDEDDLAEHGYAGVALRVMAAISQDRGATMILNVRNGSTIPGLPEDAVVEVPAVVDATGVHPLATPPPDLHQLGLMQQVKAVERATIRAALSGSRDQAVLAFGLHPLVGSLDLAERLVRGYAERIPEVAAVLRS
jgi:6-phospho-beta-glucosidase